MSDAVHLTGLLSTLGEITKDFAVDYYLSLNDSLLNFGIWCEQNLDEQTIEHLLNNSHENLTIKDYYRKFKNDHMSYDELWEPLNTVDELDAYMNKRARLMDRRWALERKANGGFSLMDEWALNPEEAKKFFENKDFNLAESKSIEEVLDGISKKITEASYEDNDADGAGWLK